MHWYGPDKHYWFRADVTVPQEMDGKPLWMHVCTQIDEWDDAKNPQFLLFANGEVIQGMDINHREVLVREHAKAGEKNSARSAVLHRNAAQRVPAAGRPGRA